MVHPEVGKSKDLMRNTWSRFQFRYEYSFCNQINKQTLLFLVVMDRCYFDETVLATLRNLKTITVSMLLVTHLHSDRWCLHCVRIFVSFYV